MDNLSYGKNQYAVGVDIGGTKILLLISDKFGNEIHKKKVDSTGNLNRICELIDEFLKEANINLDDIIGMCIGVPGEVNSNDGVVRISIQMGWKDINIKEYIGSRYNFPVYVQNDVNLAALGERWIGNGESSDNIVYISIGTGVGGAIIANGHLIEGVDFSAGEFGYIVDKDDIKKGSTNDIDEFGSLERKISGNSLSKKAEKIGFTSTELFEAYKANNESAIAIIDYFIKELSIVIANLVSILNPEFVIIGGGVSESMDCINNSIIDYVKKLTIFSTKIKLSKLGGDAGAFGCIYYVLFNGK